MRAAAKEPGDHTSYHEAAALLVAELRESRKRVQRLIRLIYQAAGQDLPVRQRLATRHRCRSRA